MNYDEMLERDREIIESIGDPAEKTWLIIQDKKEVLSEGYSELSLLTEFYDTLKEPKDWELLEFGWLWEKDYNEKDFEKTYKAFNVEVTSDDWF